MIRLKVIVDQCDTHVHCRIFVNGALSGKLVFRANEFIPFCGILWAGEAHKPKHFTIDIKDNGAINKIQGIKNDTD